jgi:hypothetical protein
VAARGGELEARRAAAGPRPAFDLTPEDETIMVASRHREIRAAPYSESLSDRDDNTREKQRTRRRRKPGGDGGPDDGRARVATVTPAGGPAAFPQVQVACCIPGVTPGPEKTGFCATSIPGEPSSLARRPTSTSVTRRPGHSVAAQPPTPAASMPKLEPVSPES